MIVMMMVFVLLEREVAEGKLLKGRKEGDCGVS
jgi:hypothetical protein